MHGKVKMFDADRGFGFIKPDTGGADVFFHVSAAQEGDDIAVGKAVSFETGTDPKNGKTRAGGADGGLGEKFARKEFGNEGVCDRR